MSDENPLKIEDIKKERERIEREYQIGDFYHYNRDTQENIKETKITSSGKFEGQPVYAPWYYGSYSEGYSDLDILQKQRLKLEESESIFIVREEEREVFPELGDIKMLHCYEDDNGFFYCERFDRLRANDSKGDTDV